MDEPAYEDEPVYWETLANSEHCSEIVNFGGYKFCYLPAGHQGEHEVER